MDRRVNAAEAFVCYIKYYTALEGRQDKLADWVGQDSGNTGMGCLSRRKRLRMDRHEDIKSVNKSVKQSVM